MGGTSSQAQTQSSTTAPWAPAQDTLTSILGQLGGQLGNTGVNGTQQNAANQIYANNATAAQFTPAVNASTSSLLAGGGALNQSPMLNSAYNQAVQNYSPLANNTDYNPMNTPGIGDQLQAINNQITQQVNGEFAAAGRQGSGYNQKALAQGLAAGEAPILTNQYNQNVSNQQNAANSLYGAGNTTGSLLSALQQQYLGNQQAGVNQVGTGNTAVNTAPTSTLQTATGLQQLPIQNLSMLANIGVPIAGLGGQSTGSASGTNTMSGAQQFATILQGIGSLGNLFKSSDRRLKQDIKQVGILDNGLPVYLYRYKAGGPFEIGLMAQDVEQVSPDAVSDDAAGFKMVNYKMATEAA